MAGEKLAMTIRSPEVKELEPMLLCQYLGDGVKPLTWLLSAA